MGRSLCVHRLDVTLDLELYTAVHTAELVGTEGRLDLPLSGSAWLELERVRYRLFRFDGFAVTHTQKKKRGGGKDTTTTNYTKQNDDHFSITLQCVIKGSVHGNKHCYRTKLP